MVGQEREGDEEQVVAVLLDLRPLVERPRVVDPERVQAEPI
jgi:hypothetical protein